MTNTFPVKSAELSLADGSTIHVAQVPAGEAPSQTRKLTRVSPVDGAPRTLGVLNVYLDHNAAEDRVIAEVRNIVVVVIVSSVLIALFVALFMQKLIAAPLRRLADQFQLTTGGGKLLEVNYDTVNPLRLRILEIDELVRDINNSRAQADSMTEKRRDSEKPFRDLAEVSSDWIWETDAALRLTYLSDRFYQLTGYAPEDCIGFPSEKFAAGSTDGPRWSRQRELIEAHRPFREFVYDLDAADGRRLTVSVNGMPLFDAGGSFAGYRGTASDITARRIAEEARDEAL
ncbi:MAG: PAS domain S-box protein [Alphaproteobacteria bacterium]